MNTTNLTIDHERIRQANLQNVPPGEFGVVDTTTILTTTRSRFRERSLKRARPIP